MAVDTAVRGVTQTGKPDPVGLCDEDGVRTGTASNPLPSSDSALLTELEKKADLNESQPVQYSDGMQLDAFSRLRVSMPHIVFDGQHHYGQQHFLFVGSAVGGGTLTDSPINSSLTLAVTASTGDKYRNASRRHYYQAGLSQAAATTFNFGVDTPAELVFRTSTSGVAVDTVVAQADWNIDSLGAGALNPSGITADWSKTQIQIQDMQWLGVGRQRVAVDINGVLIPVHQELNANNKTEVYMQTANLPICYEIEKTATGINRSVGYYDDDDGFFLRQKETTALGGTFMQICSAVFSEGASNLLAHQKSASNENVPVTAANGVLTPILSIRPAALFNTRANKGTMIPLSVEVFITGNNPIHWELWEDTTLTAPTWVPHPDADSMSEHDVSASAGTGGRWRAEGYVAAGGKGGNQSQVGETDTNYLMQIDPNNVPDVLTLMAEGIGGTAPTYCAITWAERY